MANLRNLQQAATQAAGKTVPSDKGASKKTRAVPVMPPPAPSAAPAKAASREGKIAMTFHLPEDFKRSLRLVQAHFGNGCTLEGLAEEAFNDLFSKYNVPTVGPGRR